MSRLQRLYRAVPERIGWERGLGEFLLKKLPSRTGWAATLGSVSVLMFVTMFVSGVFLAMHYNPSPDKAYAAIDYIMNDVTGGRLLRGIHHWGASAMVILGRTMSSAWLISCGCHQPLRSVATPPALTIAM